MFAATNKNHTTAWVEAEATKLGLRVEIAELGGLWEIVEIYPYRLTDEQLKAHKTLIAHKRKSRQATSRCRALCQVLDHDLDQRRAFVMIDDVTCALILEAWRAW